VRLRACGSGTIGVHSENIKTDPDHRHYENFVVVRVTIHPVVSSRIIRRWRAGLNCGRSSIKELLDDNDDAKGKLRSTGLALNGLYGPDGTAFDQRLPGPLSSEVIIYLEQVERR